MPGGPRMPQVVRRKVGVKLGSPNRAMPCCFDLTPFAPPAIDVGRASLRSWRLPTEDRPLALGQVGERGNGARSQRCDAPSATFCAPEDDPSADKGDIAPTKLHRLAHAGAR